MPATYFKCPNGNIIAIAQCLEKCPEPEGRCLSLPTLYDTGKQREWTGTPSTTQCLNPTRMEYLKITKPYTLDPFGYAFALLGTRHHRRLELVAKKIEGLISEKKLEKTEVQQHTGILDLLEPDELKDGFYKMTDYKTWGSYALAKHLGLKDNGDYERMQLALQLNDYRLKAEKFGFPISRMLVQCTVRDGGTKTAYINKIPQKIILLPIEILDDEMVIDYFYQKSTALIKALKDKVLPELCPYNERWNGRRCKGFCDLAEFCPEGAKVNKLTFKE